MCAPKKKFKKNSKKNSVVLKYGITHSCVRFIRYDSFTRETWLIHTWDMTHSHVWHDLFTCVSWLIHMCDITHSHVCHDVWHDSFICALKVPLQLRTDMIVLSTIQQGNTPYIYASRGIHHIYVVSNMVYSPYISPMWGLYIVYSHMVYSMWGIHHIYGVFTYGVFYVGNTPYIWCIHLWCSHHIYPPCTICEYTIYMVYSPHRIHHIWIHHI